MGQREDPAAQQLHSQLKKAFASGIPLLSIALNLAMPSAPAQAPPALMDRSSQGMPDTATSLSSHISHARLTHTPWQLPILRQPQQVGDSGGLLRPGAQALASRRQRQRLQGMHSAAIRTQSGTPCPHAPAPRLQCLLAALLA
jgi:hypothetical protein